MTSAATPSFTIPERVIPAKTVTRCCDCPHFHGDSGVASLPTCHHWHGQSAPLVFAAGLSFFNSIHPSCPELEKTS